MAIFEEREPGLAAAVAIPLIAFILMFPFWHIGERDLYWAEGEYAAMASEMGSFPPVNVAHGEIMPNSYPLFPLISSWLHAAGFGMEFSLRAVSVLSLAALAVLIWESCRRTMGLQAAAAAAAMTISTVLVGEKAIDGYPQMLALLFITAGWLMWFSFGQSNGNWDAAWIAAGLFGGLAFYANGWECLFYLILPLLFMRRPLAIWGKLKRPGFFAGLAILLVFIFLWGVPRWKAGFDIPLRAMPLDSGRSLLEYLGQLAVFPFEVFVRFMPWTLFAWVPFCAAIVPLDRNPLFSRFLKTIFITLFVFLWLDPLTKGRDILVLAPPLSMLVGLHYWIAVRRHGFQFLAILKWGGVGIAITALCALGYYLIPADALSSLLSLGRDISYKSSPATLARGIFESLCAVAFAVATFLLCRRRGMVWVAMLSFCVSAMLFFWAVANPYKASEKSRSKMGQTLREALGPAFAEDLLVYKDSAISGLYSECSYLGCRVRKINSVKDLPARGREIYVIASEVPSVPERTWTNLLQPETKYKDKRICLWRGVLKEDRRGDAGKK